MPPRQLIVDLVFSLFDIYRSGARSDGSNSTIPFPVLRQPSSPPIEDASGTSRPASTSFALNLPSLGNDNTTQGPGRGKERIPGGHKTISDFILSLLREPAGMKDDPSPPLPASSKENRKSIIIAPASELPAPKLEMHDFIAAAHKPRIFKTYMKELSQACWDFFWLALNYHIHHDIQLTSRTFLVTGSCITVKTESGIWRMLIQKKSGLGLQTAPPRGSNLKPCAIWSVVPSPIIFSQMLKLLSDAALQTSHFRLINTLTRTLIAQDIENDVYRNNMRKGEACKFHADMMFSGMDRILCVSTRLSGA